MELNIHHKLRLCFSGLFIIWSLASSAQEIRVVATEEPVVMYLEDGKPSGLGMDIVQSVLKKAGVPYTIGVYPWARAYLMAQTQENVIIPVIIRSPEREHLFTWIGKLHSGSYNASFFKRAGRKDVVLTKFEDAKNYNIGVMRNGNFHQFLLTQKGFEENKNVFPISKVEQNIQKLLLDRIDLFCYIDLGVFYEMKKLGIPKNKIEPALMFKEINSYMAFSKNTSDDIVKRVRKAYKELKADGTIDAISEKYLK